MKRNNIFMWAYITFMVLSCIVRLIADFSMWSPIVIAITVSSMFFAIEDLFSSISGMYERLNEIRDTCISGIKENFQQDIAVEGRIAQAYEENKDLEAELRKLFPHFEKLQNYNSEIEINIAGIEADIAKGKKIHKTCHWASIAFAYLGFLLLFMSMILVSFVEISVEIQELITVVSFAIVLATNQVSNIASEYVKKEENATNHVLSSYDEAIKATQEMEVKVYKMIAMMKKQKATQIQEATANAD